jgi:outer membrane protein TolC
MRSSLLFLVAAALLCAAEPEPQILSPVPTPQVTPQVKDTQVTSKFTPTASAPAFGTPSWFRHTFRTPTQPKIELRNPTRLTDFVVDGKLELSLRSYTDLVLANNTDVSIERLSIELDRNAIMRAYYIFDPNFLGTFTTTRTQVPLTQRIDRDPSTGGVILNQSDFVVSSLSQPARFTYDQLLPTGTRYTVGFSASKSSTNSRNQLFNPLINSGLNVNLQQPLLRNRGMYLTKLPVTIARSRLRVGEYNIEGNLLRLVTDAENAYWDVILRREDLSVQEKALSLAEQSLKRAQRELELGAISALEIYQPEAQYANYRILVTQARFRLQQAENTLRRFIGADLDPQYRAMPLSLTEAIAPPVETKLEPEPLVERAIRQRPDLKARHQLLDVDDLNVQNAANSLKPDFALTGQYSSTGQGIFWTDNGYAPGGFGNAVGQLFGFGFPTYGFGLRLSLPLRDRRASADYADAVVSKRLDMLRLRSAEQTARQEVLNAISSVESSRASVELAKIALDFAQKRVDADQKRYDLGTITLFFLLQSQTDLAQAESNLVNQAVLYRRNLLNLQRITGDLLTERNITIP